MFDRCVWLNEPRDWHLEADVLDVSTEQETDFWRETHYGFTEITGISSTARQMAILLPNSGSGPNMTSCTIRRGSWCV